MTDITELAQRMKAAAVRAKAATEDYVAHRMSFTVCLEECKEFNDLSDGPDNILALVEALEKAQAQSSKWLEAYHKAVSVGARYEERIAELESSVIAPGILRCTECSFVQTKNIICVTADTITTGNSEPEPCPNGCGQLQPVNWKALAIQLMFTTKQGVSDLLEAKKRIAELEEAEHKLCAANVTLDARAEFAERQLAGLESRLESADKLQDSAFRSGLQQGFSLGQTDDQKGYEQSMAAYSPAAGIREAE